MNDEPVIEAISNTPPQRGSLGLICAGIGPSSPNIEVGRHFIMMSAKCYAVATFITPRLRRRWPLSLDEMDVSNSMCFYLPVMHTCTWLAASIYIVDAVSQKTTAAFKASTTSSTILYAPIW